MKSHNIMCVTTLLYVVVSLLSEDAGGGRGDGLMENEGNMC